MDDTIFLGDKAERIIDLSEIGFACDIYTNPVGNFSVIPWGDYYLASFRTFAYYITTEIHRYIFKPNMKLRNPHTQLFCLFDKDFNLVRHLPCEKSTYWNDPLFQDKLPYLEDMRLVVWNGEVYGATTIFYQGVKGYARIGMQVQKVRAENGVVECEHFWNSLPVGIGGIQKNWMPVPDKPFKYISATYQNGAQMIDITTNQFTEGGSTDGELYRGNTPLVKTPTGYMTITHILDFDERKRKRYNNFLVEYNADLSIRRISRPFKLCESNIEFITTFLELPDDKVMIGVTEMDEKPMAMIFNKGDFVSKIAR